MDTKPVLLRESEVAQRLRCSTSKVKKLRRSGQLAYIPGRPLFIIERPIAFLERVRVEAKTTPAPQNPAISAAEMEQIKAQVRRVFLKRQLRARGI